MHGKVGSEFGSATFLSHSKNNQINFLIRNRNDGKAIGIKYYIKFKKIQFKSQMGNKQVHNFNWEQQYRTVEKNFNDGTLLVEKKHSKGSTTYIGRQLVSNDQTTWQRIRSLIQLKLNNTNPYITCLQTAYTSSEDALCSKEDKVFLLFKHPGSTLKQQIIARRFANERFTQPQIDILLQSTVKAIKSLKYQGHPHNNVSSCSIFLNEERQIILGDPWATPPAYNLNQNQNGFSYPSPQKILYQNDQIFQYDPYRSDLFSVGTVALQSIFLEHMDVIYEKGFRRVVQAKIEQKLSKIENPQLKKKLQILLSFDPKFRQNIYNLYESEYSDEGLRRKLAKFIHEKADGRLQENYEKQTLTQVSKPLKAPPTKVSSLYSSQSHHTHHNRPKSIVRINYINRPVVQQKPIIDLPISCNPNNNLQVNNSPKIDFKQLLMSQSFKEVLKTSSQSEEKQKKQQQPKEQVEEIKQTPLQHISIYTVGMNKLKDKTPTQSIQLQSQEFINEHRKTISENSDRGFLQYLNDAQLYQESSIHTPDKKPKKKYNSTIKQVSQNSSKSQEQENTVYVEEQYNVGRYEGLKKNGLRNGRGKFYYSEGSIYQGQWKNNQMHGYGILYYSDGRVAYEGEWFEDEFHGLGKVYNQEQNQLIQPYDYTNLSDFEDYWLVYEGQLVSDRRHGKGKITLSNGQVFVGRFNKDVIEGEGEYHTLGGEVVYGKWQNNQLIKLI